MLCGAFHVTHLPSYFELHCLNALLIKIMILNSLINAKLVKVRSMELSRCPFITPNDCCQFNNVNVPSAVTNLDR